MYPNVFDEVSLRNRSHVFVDRVQAADVMAERLRCYVTSETCVLAIPSGGIPIACTVSEKLGCPMDLVLVRKIPVPWNPEAGFGAITVDGTMVLNDHLVSVLGLSEKEVGALASQVVSVIRAREKKFRLGTPPVPLRDKSVTVTDDGLASGYTMLAAVKFVRKSQPREVVVSVPTASIAAVRLVAEVADRVVCLNIRDEFVYAVADAYENWHDISDEEALTYLKQSRRSGTDTL